MKPKLSSNFVRMVPFVILSILLVGFGGYMNTKVIGFLGFGVLFLGSGLVQLSTGYTWRNLKNGCRGYARAGEPFRYWLSVSLHLCIFGLIVIYALSQL